MSDDAHVTPDDLPAEAVTGDVTPALTGERAEATSDADLLADGKLGFEIEGESREPGAPIIENPAESAETALAD